MNKKNSQGKYFIKFFKPKTSVLGSFKIVLLEQYCCLEIQSN